MVNYSHVSKLFYKLADHVSNYNVELVLTRQGTEHYIRAEDKHGNQLGMIIEKTTDLEDVYQKIKVMNNLVRLFE